jgi:hypothetical protein
MKLCSKCLIREVKPNQFYCSECVREYNRNYRIKNREKIREWSRIDYLKFGRRPSKNSNTVVRKAHKAIECALRYGKLARPTRCDNCGSSDRKIQAHHGDYSKLLSVEWLCPICHAISDGKVKT